MAVEDMRDKRFDNRTADELLDIASKGGKASGKARREKKKLREQMEMLLSLPASQEAREQMSSMGIEESEQDNQMALVIAMAAQGLKGDVAAFNSIRDLIGEKPVDKVRAEVTTINEKDVEEMERYMTEQWEKEKITEV